MKANIYKIEALTNLHVGSGDANYGVIDNLIQRDVVTEFPTINGSSLKGAIKEFFENKVKEKQFDNNKLIDIFGDKDQNAAYKFLSANLLAIPVRSNKKPYFLATCPYIIEKLQKDAKDFGLVRIQVENLKNFKPKTGKPIVFTNDIDGLLIEDFTNFEKKDTSANCDFFEDCDNVVIFSDEDFKELINDFNLPVIARNKVGENKNLWYEQVVPSKSLFYFIVISNEQYLSDFENILKSDAVHIGGNATVGLGFTNISKF